MRVGDIEFDTNNETVNNDRTVKLTLLKGNSTDTLLVLDKEALEQLKQATETELTKINNTVHDRVDDIDKKVDDAKQDAIKQSKDYTNSRFSAMQQPMVSKHEQIDKSIANLTKTVNDNKTETDKKITTDIKTAVDELKNNDIKTLTEGVSKNADEITKVRAEMDYYNNGDIHFCGIISESSTSIKTKPNGKDTYLTNYVKNNGYPRGPKNGYFIKCDDGVNFFYMEYADRLGIWHEVSVSAGFTTSNPLTLTNGTLNLSLDTNSGLSVNTAGQLTFTLPSGGNFSNYARKNQEESIEKVWTFKKGIKTEDGVSVGETDGNVYIDTDNLIVKSKTNGSVEIKADQNITLTPTSGDIIFSKVPKSTNEATDDAHLTNLGQVKKLVEASKGLTYTATAPLKIENTQISLDYKTDGLLKVDNGQLDVDKTNLVFKNVSGDFEGRWTYKKGLTVKEELKFLSDDDALEVNIKTDKTDKSTIVEATKGSIKFKVDANNTDGKIEFEKPIHSSQSATEDSHVPNWKQVQDKITEEVGKVNTGGTPPVGGQQPVTPTIDLSKYPKKDQEETIDKKWTFSEAPNSSKDATQDTELVRYSQVKDLINNGGVTNPPTNNNIDLTDYVKKNEANTYTAKQTFNQGVEMSELPKFTGTETNEPTDENQLPTWKQVKNLVKTSPTQPQQPSTGTGGSCCVGKDGENIYEIWKKAKAENLNKSVDQFLEDMKGKKGDKGERGDQGDPGDKGPKGDSGPKGESAYDIWKRLQPEGSTNLTEQDFINSLKGEKGDPGVLELPDGVTGDTANQIQQVATQAVEQINTKTEEGVKKIETKKDEVLNEIGNLQTKFAEENENLHNEAIAIMGEIRDETTKLIESDARRVIREKKQDLNNAVDIAKQEILDKGDFVTNKVDDHLTDTANKVNAEMEKNATRHLDNIETLASASSKALMAMRPPVLTFETVSKRIMNYHGYYFQIVWRNEDGKIVKYGDFIMHQYFCDGKMGDNDRKTFFRVPLPPEIEFQELCQVGSEALIAIPRKGQSEELDKTLYVYGNTSDYKLGTGNTNYVYRFTPIVLKDAKGHDEGSKVKSVLKLECPASTNTDKSVYALVEMKDGSKSIYATGKNNYGGLGRGNYVDVTEWTLIKPKVKNFHCTDFQSIIVEEDTTENKFVACGANACKALGVGERDKLNNFMELTVQPDPGTKFQSMLAWKNGIGRVSNWMGTNVIVKDGCLHMVGDNFSKTIPSQSASTISIFTKMTIDGKPLMPLKNDPKYYKPYFWGVFFIGYIGAPDDSDRKEGIFFVGDPWHCFSQVPGCTERIFQIEFYDTDNGEGLTLEDLEIIGQDQTAHFHGDYHYRWMLFVNRKKRRVWNVGDAIYGRQAENRKGYELELPQKAKECVYFEPMIWTTSHSKDGGIIIIMDDEVWAFGDDTSHYFVNPMNAQRLALQYRI